jgi:hypothetical protein
VFASAGLVLTFVWLGFVLPGTGADDVGPGIGLTAAAVGVFFWLFAVTEEEELSPRVWTLVPRRRFFAILSIPFLPGGGRGFLFTLIFGILAILGSALYPRLAGGRAPDRVLFDHVCLAWLYAVIYAGIGRILRSWCGPGPARTRRARLLMLGVFTLAIMGPILLTVMIDEGLRRWSFLHILNPIWTLAEHGSRGQGIRIDTVLMLLAALAILLNTPAMVRGAREVMAASKERRAREA